MTLVLALLPLAQDPAPPLELGKIVVEVTDKALPASTTATVTSADIRERDYRIVSDALNLVPGVSIQRIGPRNELGVYVRGFDVRQTPLYIDGIPVYVPYDGYVDFGRFLTHEFSEMQVSKGFTSPLYGPNAIGAAINLVSREPKEKVDLDLGTGFASGDTINGFANVGTRLKKVWMQGAFAWLSSGYLPLSGGGRLSNSYQSDYRGRFKAAWTPKDGEQYVFGFAQQVGEKGNPPYAGTDPAVRIRYWRWPQWDKRSVYFIGNKNLGERSYARLRAYHDKFDNLLNSYDDARYSTQTRPSSFTSPYDDATYGGTLEMGTRWLPAQSIKGSFYFKDDTHREGNVGEPLRTFRDQSISVGFEDTIRLGERTSAIFAFSADRIDVRNAQNFANGQVTPFPRNTLWAYNPQVGVFHALTQSSKVHFSFGRKTRLPTIKDRYSYRLGQAIPNPDLREERSQNWDVGYSRTIGVRTLVEASLFRSDVSNATLRFFVSPNVFQLRNLGEARYQGAEFGIRTTPVRSTTLIANYTYLTRRNRTQPSLIQTDTPRHKGYASGAWSPREWISLFADWRYEGGRWNQNDAGRFVRAPAFGVVGLGATIRPGGGIELQFGATNLGDRSYFLADGFPEMGRSVFVNLRYRM